MGTEIPPFNDESPEMIFQHILDRDIPWPAVPEEMSEEAYDLINRLLEPNPSERLGANGVEEIKSHPFFADINWDTLYLEPRTSTFVPRTKDRYDTGYFVPRQDGSDDSFRLPLRLRNIPEERSYSLDLVMPISLR